MGLFGDGKKKDPREMVREMQSKIRKETRKLERDIANIQRAMKAQENEIRKYAKENNMGAAKIIAKEIANTKKAVNRLYCAKAEMNSVVMNLNHQASMVRVAGNLQSSTEVLKSMSALVKIPEINATMRELSKEMTKAGIMEDMIDDTMSSMEPEDMEDAAQEEIDKILYDITSGAIGKAPDAVADSLPQPKGAMGGQEDEEEEDFSDMQARLQALRS